jgi:hypothetical protein
MVLGNAVAVRVVIRQVVSKSAGRKQVSQGCDFELGRGRFVKYGLYARPSSTARYASSCACAQRIIEGFASKIVGVFVGGAYGANLIIRGADQC